MAKPIKVTYIVSDLAVGGAEVMLCKLLAGTDRERFEPVVVSLMNRGPLREKIEALGVRVYSIGVRPNLPTPLNLFPLIRLLRRLQPDLIVGWMYHGCLAAQLSSMFSLRSSKVLWSIHYSISSLVSEKRLTAAVIKACALLSRLPAKIVFVSHDGQSKHRLLGFHTENSCVIPNGIDAEEFRPCAGTRESVRSEFRLPDDAVIIGMVSRYHPMKDYPNFIRAAAIVSQSYPHTRFLLIGRGADNNNRELLSLIENFGLAGQVHLLGERHDIPRLVAALDIFSLASAYGESFPTVIVEAMASAVPCAVTDVGDASWIVGPTGRVVPPRNPEALGVAWSALIAMTADERAALGLSARARVCELFPIASVVQAYESLFEGINADRVIAEASKPIAAVPTQEVILVDSANDRNSALLNGPCDLSLLKVNCDPFAHVVHGNFIEPEHYQQLSRTFPTCPPSSGPTGFSLYWGDEDYKRLLDREPAWRALFETFHSQRFIEWATEQFADVWQREGCMIDLSRARYVPYREDRIDKERGRLRKIEHEPHELWVRMDIHQGRPGYCRPKHLDHARRLVSMLIYMCDQTENQMTGGELLLHGPNPNGEAPTQISPRHNLMVAFPCSNQSQHSVSKIISAAAPRNYLQVHLSSSVDVWPRRGNPRIWRRAIASLKRRLKLQTT